MKLTKVILLTTILTGLLSGLSFATEFSDIENHWAKDYVESLTDSGLIGGYEDGTFRPDNTIRVDEFIVLGLKALDIEVDTSQSNGDWAKPYVDAGYKVLYFNGDYEEFDRPITREEMAKMVIKIIVRYREEFEEAYRFNPYFEIKDFDLVRESNKRPVSILYSLGILNGNADKTFDPKGTLTRAEASTVLYKVLHPEARQPVVTDSIPTLETIQYEFVDVEGFINVHDILYAPYGADGQYDLEAFDIYNHFESLEGYDGTKTIELLHHGNQNIILDNFKDDVTMLSPYARAQVKRDFTFSIHFERYDEATYPYDISFSNWAMSYDEIIATHRETLNYLYEYLFGEDAEFIASRIQWIYEQGSKSYADMINEVYTLKNGRTVELTSNRSFGVHIGKAN